ncbi:hypothetical protein NL676_005862 [Syzygium grande]|nr:hypothetical protein NL676_005862 [Syzygium grande]
MEEPRSMLEKENIFARFHRRGQKWPVKETESPNPPAPPSHRGDQNLQGLVHRRRTQSVTVIGEDGSDGS